MTFTPCPTCPVPEACDRASECRWTLPAALMPLEVWARTQYGEHAPSVRTLRRWVRERRIAPLPERHGLRYYVRADARYVEPRPAGGRLVDRIKA